MSRIDRPDFEFVHTDVKTTLLNGEQGITKAHRIKAVRQKIAQVQAQKRSGAASKEHISAASKLEEYFTDNELDELMHFFAAFAGLKSTWFHSALAVFFSKFNDYSKMVGALRSIATVGTNFYATKGAFRKWVLNIIVLGRHKDTDNQIAASMAIETIKYDKQKYDYNDVDFKRIDKEIKAKRKTGGSIMGLLETLSSDLNLNNATRSYAGVLRAAVYRDIRDIDGMTFMGVTQKNFCANHCMARNGDRTRYDKDVESEDFDKQIIWYMCKTLGVNPIDFAHFAKDKHLEEVKASNAT